MKRKSEPKRTLITGGSGKLGSALKNVFPNALVPSREELDIADPESCSYYFKQQTPDGIDCIIHAAAMTDVSACEKKKELAWTINVKGTENVFKEAKAINPNVYFLFISTAGVFSGREGNYDEDALPYPRNFYGFTKYIAEERLRGQPNVCIIRTNFVAKEPWPHPKAFTDRQGTYLYTPTVAQAIREVVDAHATGIIHICGDKKMSMFELAKMTTPDIQPTTLAEHSDGALLTKDMSLITKRWRTYRLTD